ncbi:MAG: DNA-binding protein [Verrucomicrobiota bacterium]|nr:DNA-binding protein [Verrucomicrobiota bacterium]
MIARFFVAMDNVITTIQVPIERKNFVIDLCENNRGKFLRIVEEAHGRRNIVIVPSTGLADFARAIATATSVT